MYFRSFSCSLQLHKYILRDILKNSKLVWVATYRNHPQVLYKMHRKKSYNQNKISKSIIFFFYILAPLSSGVLKNESREERNIIESQDDETLNDKWILNEELDSPRAVDGKSLILLWTRLWQWSTVNKELYWCIALYCPIKIINMFTSIKKLFVATQNII